MSLQQQPWGQYDSDTNSTTYKLFDQSEFFRECESILGQKYTHFVLRFQQIVRDYNDYISVLQSRN
jgi:hypothetical protein